MRFLLDAHLPRRLRAMLAQHGHDTVHTLDMPSGNATRNRVFNQLSLEEQRIVISKDSDFFFSHLLQGRPWKLLLRTGTISTHDLCVLFERNLPAIEAAFASHTLAEVDRTAVTPVA